MTEMLWSPMALFFLKLLHTLEPKLNTHTCILLCVFYCNIHKTNWTSCKDVWLEIGLDGLILLISDIDECALGTHNCPNGYECLNIEGSFRCRQPACQRGTRFSGATGRCEPIECPRGREADSLGMCVGVYLYWSIHSIHNHPYYLIYCSINWLQRFFDFFNECILVIPMNNQVNFD